MKKNSHITLLGVFSVLILLAFAKPPIKSQEDLAKEYINEKLESVKSDRWDYCYLNILKDAEAYVDSFIAEKSTFSIGDSIKAPAKPPKPTRPFDTLRLDSTLVVPIFQSKKIINQGE